ncbi:NfeD family protein [Funiculus sociatus GB2-M2]|uniref:NfeD family protein n=1 Tax=Funiculus sociatus TaxID=450527 RepID=UPI00329815B9
MLNVLLKLLFRTEEQSKVEVMFPENEATVTQVIRQGAIWRVSYRASYWEARSVEPITLLPGDLVYVIGSQNITLVIEPSALPIFRDKPNLTLVSPNDLARQKNHSI